MKLTMDLGPRSYDIVIKRGVLHKARLLANLEHDKVLVVSDDGVPKKYAAALLRQCRQGFQLVLPAGEANKSVAAWQAVLSRLNALGFGKRDIVVGVGGGVVCDVAGFAAASYLHGVPLCLFPTTTTAQLDAAVGGRPALNLDGAKDRLGTNYQPGLVCMDTDTLATLPRRHYNAGMVEAVKTALVCNKELFEILEAADVQEDIERILYLCASSKADLVRQDEACLGVRRLLGFGHLFGLAIEAACGFGENALPHGECVALGMLPFIESRALLRRTRAVLRRLGVPLRLPLPAAEVLAHLPGDVPGSPAGCPVVRVKQLGQGYLETLDWEELELLWCGGA